MQRYYQAVWKTRNVQDMVIIKTLLYTAVRSLIFEGREELMPYGSRKKPNSGSARTDTM
jgi:hypothetical protein